jgi:hypothetical protein
MEQDAITSEIAEIEGEADLAIELAFGDLGAE